RFPAQASPPLLRSSRYALRHAWGASMIFEERENALPHMPLDQVEMFYGRFVSYPNEHALVAHTLWTAHTHLQACAETTPRLAFMSPEKASGKTRALEVTALLVKDQICSLNASPASVVRLIA